MKIDIICFTPQGYETAKRIKMDTGSIYCKFEDTPAGAAKYTGSISEWAKERFTSGRAMVFVGALGIAVRAIAPFVNDKLTDPPVVVIDDGAAFVIPLLSGHLGGANELAIRLSEKLGAIPVITTSTDVNSTFSPDLFAKSNNLRIRNREGIKKTAAKSLSDKIVTLSIKDFPPKEKVDIMISHNPQGEYRLLLSPKKYTLGLGMKRDTDPAKLEAFILENLSEMGLGTDEIYALCSIDIKEKEPALRAFSEKYRIPVITFEASILDRVPGEFSASEFVKEKTGTDNVCERSAMAAAGSAGHLTLRKKAKEGMTIAIACRGED